MKTKLKQLEKLGMYISNESSKLTKPKTETTVITIISEIHVIWQK